MTHPMGLEINKMIQEVPKKSTWIYFHDFSGTLHGIINYLMDFGPKNN